MQKVMPRVEREEEVPRLVGQIVPDRQIESRERERQDRVEKQDRAGEETEDAAQARRVAQNVSPARWRMGGGSRVRASHYRPTPIALPSPDHTVQVGAR